MTRKELRPWNVKKGDRIAVPAFPFEQTDTVDGRPVRWLTVDGVSPDRNFLSGERCWTVYGTRTADGRFPRIGTYYRDERVTVERKGEE